MAEQAENKSWYQKTWWKITSYILVFFFGVSVGQDSEKKAERAEAVVVEKIVVAEKPPTAVAEKPLVLDPFPQRPVDPPYLKLNGLLLLGVSEILLLFQMQAKFLKLLLFLLCLRNC